MIQVREYARLTTDERATPSLDCAVVKRETLEWVQKLASEWKGEEPLLLSDGYHVFKVAISDTCKVRMEKGLKFYPRQTLGRITLSKQGRSYSACSWLL